MDFFKKFLGVGRLDPRHAGNAVNGPDVFNHASGGAAASIPVSVGNQDLPAQLLILELPPGSHDGFRRNFPVIGGSPSRYRHAGGGHIHEIGEHFRPVNAAPAEQVVGNGVELVPADFRSHEGIQAAKLHNLGQRPAVAEHIRQPEEVAFFPELLLDKTDAIQKLPGKALAGGHITVRLQPHAAIRLPASFLHTLLDSFVNFRAVFFQKFI